MNSIAIIDDNPIALAQMRQVLERAGLGEVKIFTEPQQAMSEFRNDPPGVLLVDYVMPQMDGVQFLQALEREGIARHTPVAMVSGFEDLDELMLPALQAGAHEVIAKPIKPREFALIVRNLLRLTTVSVGGGAGASVFRPLVVPRTGGVLQPRSDRRVEDAALVRMLDKVASIRDEGTGKHTVRMAQYAAAIAHAYGMSIAQQNQLLAAAPLHDIGKIGVPDHILLKPGALTPPERELMKRHTTIGYELLRDEESPVLQLGAEIALGHHERWDGAGYPLGLSGDAIPLSARLVAVADAFDAMTTVRPYKQAWLIERAVAVIEADSGRHFDPAVVDAFIAALDDIRRIKSHFDGDQPFIHMATVPH